MMTHPLPLGTTVYRATYGRNPVTIACPDCGGTKQIHVTLHDGSTWAISCGGCDPGGYQGPSGVITQYVYDVQVTTHRVTGVTIRADATEYELDNTGSGGYFTGSEKTVFATDAEARRYGESEQKERETEENRRLLAKTKDARSWAWNLAYHRKCIAQAEQDLAYHRQKVAICQQHVKGGNL